MRKVAAMLALGLALTGCAGTAQQHEESARPATSQTLITPDDVDITMTAATFAEAHGLKAAETEPSMFSMTAAYIGHIETTEATGLIGDVRLDTYTSREARDSAISTAKEMGSFIVGGEQNHTYWTASMGYVGVKVADVMRVAKALSK